MENNQSNETVRTVTQNDPVRTDNQGDPIRSSNQVESFRSTSQGAPVRSTTEVNTVRTNKQDSRNRTSSITRVVYWLLGILEGLLAFRLILKLLGANANSTFVSFVYNITRVFVAPFAGIFKSSGTGIETSTIIAILVYALAGWGIAKLVAIVTNTSSVDR